MGSERAPVHLGTDAAGTGLEAAWRSERDAMVRAVSRSWGDHHIAAEIVDEAFASVAARLTRGPVDDLPGYLWRAAFNASIRTRRQRQRSLEAHDRAGRLAATTVGTPEGGWDEDLMSALAGLDERTSIVLVLRFWGDLTVPQIAEHQGLALGTAKSVIHRGIAALRRELAARTP